MFESLADTFSLAQSKVSRDSLNALVPPPSRLPAVCSLPKNFFYCPLPAWSLQCGLAASECLPRPPIVNGTISSRYVEDSCPIENEHRSLIAFPCRVIDCSSEQPSSSCAKISGWPDCPDVASLARCDKAYQSIVVVDQQRFVRFTVTQRTSGDLLLGEVQFWHRGDLGVVAVRVFNAQLGGWFDCGMYFPAIYNSIQLATVRDITEMEIRFRSSSNVSIDSIMLTDLRPSFANALRSVSRLLYSFVIFLTLRMFSVSSVSYL